jgi:protein NrfD
MRRIAMVLLGLVWLVLMVIGLAGVYLRLTTGHTLEATGNFIFWGLLVSAYIWFIGLSAGSFLLSSLIYVFGVERLKPLGKAALLSALVTLLAALVTIWMDIGHMGRFWEIYTRGNPFSMMAWMVWLYTAYFALLMVEFWFAIRADLVVWSRRPGFAGVLSRLLTFGVRGTDEASLRRDERVVKVLGTIGVPLAVAFHGGVGALFGVVMARPYWNQPLYPIAFLVGALLSGTALFSVLVGYFWPERQSENFRQIIATLARYTLGLLVLYLLLEWAEFSIGLYNMIIYQKGPEEALSFWVVLGGPFNWSFWLIHLILGSIVPLVILAAWPRNANLVGIAGLLIAASFLAVRLNIVIPALAAPPLPGLAEAYSDLRLTVQYFPSPVEWAILSFSVALSMMLFFLGFRLLPVLPYREEAKA